MDWRHAYHEHQRMVLGQIAEAQALGLPRIRLATRTVDLVGLTTERAATEAMRDAESIINHAIRQEAAAKAA